MKQILSHFILSSLLFVLALFASCTKIGDEVVYCNPEDQSWLQRQGAMHINLERGLIYGDDTSGEIYPLVVDDLVGFEGNFPLLLFKDSVDPKQIQGDIVANEVVFRVSPVEDNSGDLWLITARPREAGSQSSSHLHSTVLYSTDAGVLLIRFTGLIDGEKYSVNNIPCGNKTLRYEALYSFAHNND